MPTKSQEPTFVLINANINSGNYASKELYYTHLFEQYKIFVKMADKISERRNLTNTFFLSLHTLIIGLISFFYEKGPKITFSLLNIFPLIAFLLLCFVWWRLLISYRQLNSAKYKVIREFEKELPTSPYWNAEWKLLGQGKEPSLYKPLTDLENLVPMVFAGLYIMGAITIILL